LPQETADDDLGETTCPRVWKILRCSAGFGDILEIFYAAALLDIVGEISTRTVFHDKVYVALSALQGPSTGKPNYGRGCNVRRYQLIW
jgi:hypothetical protein